MNRRKKHFVVRRSHEQLHLLRSSKICKILMHLSCTYLPGAKTRIKRSAYGTTEIEISAFVPENINIDTWKIVFSPEIKSTFHYTPHLTPCKDYVVDQHVFRTPVLMTGNENIVVCLLPAIENNVGSGNRQYMDLDAVSNTMTVGICTNSVAEHVLFKNTHSAVIHKGYFSFKAHLMILIGENAKNPYKAILNYWWSLYGKNDIAQLPQMQSLIKYADRTYSWAFDKWKGLTWQEFTLCEKIVGAQR